MSAFVANTNVLELLGLKNEVDGSYINDANVTATVKDADGNNVSGTSWPLTMPYVASSNGNYRAFLAASLPLVAKQKYTAVIEVNGGTDAVGHFELTFKPVVRTVADA